jgi:hypothetical protein
MSGSSLSLLEWLGEECCARHIADEITVIDGFADVIPRGSVSHFGLRTK